jgi:uncharacterized protein YjiK
MGAGYVFYAIISDVGKPRRNRNRMLMVYDSLTTAKRVCGVGDSVVQLTWDSDHEPLFIKERISGQGS